MRVDEMLATRARVAEYLEGRGFAPCLVPRGYGSFRSVAFEGTLLAGAHSEVIKIVIDDWDFVSPPRILLGTASPLRKGTHPHVGKGGELCYRTDGLGVLNAFAPANAVAACLTQASHAIEQIAGGGKWAEAEYQREFEAYWDGSILLSCGLDGARSDARLLFSEDASRLHGWLYQDETRARAIVAAMGMTATGSTEAMIFSTIRPLSIGVDGAPGDLKTLLHWLRQFDQSLEVRIRSAIARKDYFVGASPFLVIAGPNAQIAVTTSLSNAARQYFERRPREFPNRVLNPRMPPIEITRWTVSDASPEFIYSRNGQKTLGGKRLTLIGAGAIGGYLADCLVRLGAGHAGGRLIIIDPDILLPANIGRHRLGMDNVFRSKAKALADRLRNEFPWLDVQAISEDARLSPSLLSGDLVIDATGEEALGRALNRTHQRPAGRRNPPPVLYSWIAGEGEGAQALWVEAGGGYACWECLLEHTENGDWKTRFPFVKHETDLRMVGCSAVTPYAASAAMSAAALAAEMVADWLNGKIDPRFRSRARSHADVTRAKDRSPDRLKRCPACSQT